MASTLFTAGIILGITFLFIYFFSILHKRGKKKAMEIKKTKFEDLISSNSLSINEKEELSNYVIAIDIKKAKVLYLNFSNTKEEPLVIDLRKIKSSKVEIEENTIYEEKKGKSVFVEKRYEKILLELLTSDANHKKYQLTFYDVHQDAMLDFKVVKKRVEHWQSTINSNIKQLTPSPK